MIYTIENLNNCHPGSVVYLDGNEHDAYTVVATQGPDVVVQNLRSSQRLRLPGEALCEVPRAPKKEELAAEGITLAEVPAAPRARQNEILSKEVLFHRQRSISSRRTGHGATAVHVTEHEVTPDDDLYEMLLEAGFDPEGECSEIILGSPPEGVSPRAV